MKTYHLIYRPNNDTYTLRMGKSDLVKDIPAGVIKELIHRLLLSLTEYTIDGKEKAYGGDE